MTGVLIPAFSSPAAAVAALPRAAAMAVPPAEAEQLSTVQDLVRGFLLSKRSATTRAAYTADLASWLHWCTQLELDPLRAGIHHADAYLRLLTEVGDPRTGRALAAAACAQRSAAAVRACSSGATSAEAERSCGPRAPLSSHGRWVRLPALTSCVEFQPAGLSDCYAPLSLAVHSFFYGAPLAGKACSTLEGEVRICKTAR